MMEWCCTLVMACVATVGVGVVTIILVILIAWINTGIAAIKKWRKK